MSTPRLRIETTMAVLGIAADTEAEICIPKFDPSTPCANRPRKESFMSGTITAKRIVSQPYFSMICVLSLIFVLPRYGGVALMIGSACVLSAYAAVLPEQFRSRNGSMKTATCLVAAAWVAAAIITAMTLMGEIQG